MHKPIYLKDARIRLIQVFSNAIALTTKPRVDVRECNASMRGLVVKSIASRKIYNFR